MWSWVLFVDVAGAYYAALRQFVLALRATEDDENAALDLGLPGRAQVVVKVILREPGLLEFIKQHSSGSMLTRPDENQVLHSLTVITYPTLSHLIRRCPSRPSRSGLTGR